MATSIGAIINHSTSSQDQDTTPETASNTSLITSMEDEVENRQPPADEQDVNRTGIPQTVYVDGSPSGEIQFRTPVFLEGNPETQSRHRNTRVTELEIDNRKLHRQLETLQKELNLMKDSGFLRHGVAEQGLRDGSHDKNTTSNGISLDGPLPAPLARNRGTEDCRETAMGLASDRFTGKDIYSGGNTRDMRTGIGSMPGRELPGHPWLQTGTHEERSWNSLPARDCMGRDAVGDVARGLHGGLSRDTGYVGAPTQKHRNRKPATFDGTGNWPDYLIHFEMVAEINGWDDGSKALELAAALRGVAQGVLSDLSPAERTDVGTLKAALTARFQPEHQMEIYKAQVRGRLRRRDEPLPELAHDVKRLVRLAYPDAQGKLRQQPSMDAFTEALNDSDMEWVVHQGKPRDMEDAVRIALEYEAFQTGKRKRIANRVRFQKEVEDDDELVETLANRVAHIQTKKDKESSGEHNRQWSENTNRNHRTRLEKVECYLCGEMGHVCRKCPQRKKSSTQESNRQYNSGN